MTLIEFARLVQQMRELQTQFLRTRAEERPPDLFGRARAVERQVDRAAALILEGPGLFDEED